jgi:hypothetical protein
MVRLFRLFRWFPAVGAVVTLAGCASSSSSPAALPLTGVWGGNDISLTVADTGSHLEFDCAHGDIPGALTVDARNQFDVQGIYVREHGAVLVGEPPDSHPADYAGSITGTSMSLTARLTDTNQMIGTFVLTRGSAGRVLKCL